jgi:hypothetical protein
VDHPGTLASVNNLALMLRYEDDVAGDSTLRVFNDFKKAAYTSPIPGLCQATAVVAITVTVVIAIIVTGQSTKKGEL